MSKPPAFAQPATSAASLTVRRTIAASTERLFDAWTQPQQLKQWWGPGSAECTDAEVDLRVGGRYRIANQFPDGKVLWIAGEFESIERPKRLVYTWRLESVEGPPERVTVTFEKRDSETEVVVTHERIATKAIRDRHEQGWSGCLDGLAAWVSSSARPGV
ncbi:MAG: SRPBCC family protein [Terriglobales bacterium]